jgi:hypothetical protein
MRVALLLYGKLHIHTQYRPHCSQYYDLLNFIGRENTIDIFYSGDYETEEWVSKFKENYKPVKCVIDRIIHPNIMSAYPGRVPGVDNEALYDVGCIMINKMRVFMLLEEHIKETNANYDLVICMNNHVKVNTHLNLSNSAIGENIVYIPVREQEIEGSLNDTLAIGMFETMKKYCELYKYMQYLLEQKLSIPSAEHLNLASLTYNKVNIVRIPFSYSILNE